jgi:hypothetical protein
MNGIYGGSFCWASKTTLSHVHPCLFISQKHSSKIILSHSVLHFYFMLKSDKLLINKTVCLNELAVNQKGIGSAVSVSQRIEEVPLRNLV